MGLASSSEQASSLTGHKESRATIPASTSSESGKNWTRERERMVANPTPQLAPTTGMQTNKIKD
jgi:hypothetical protein